MTEPDINQDALTKLHQALDQADALLDLDDDTPLAPVCDLSGDGTCEACQ